jgi:hypothetical protein
VSEHPLFPAQEAKREAIERVERNASPDFLDFARTIALRIAAAQPNGFTTDAIWEVLDASGVKPPEPRALGAVMKRLADEGLIRKTGEYVDSTRAVCHGRLLAIWAKA